VPRLSIACVILGATLALPAAAEVAAPDGPQDRPTTQDRFDRAQFLTDVNVRLNMIKAEAGGTKVSVDDLVKATQEARALLNACIHTADHAKQKSEAKFERRLLADFEALEPLLKEGNQGEVANKVHDAEEAMKSVQTLIGTEG
jgi:hypothetical protein